MTNDFYTNTYNPDILSCIANLSSDEVFTTPEIVNNILDMLPSEIWSDRNVRFLDPACKSGVFLREIAKRLLVGLQKEIPELQDRIEHIYKNQIFGYAITELTSLLSRRSLYCSKYPNSKYSVSVFSTPSGNISYSRINHKWEKEKCIFCGAPKSEYSRSNELESHAYEFIHIEKMEEYLKMKFDVIIGNPPYQLDTGGSGKQAKPIYNLFVEQAKKLKPRYISMIIPSRWFAGGMGLDSFRKTMLNDSHIRKYVDFTNAKDCFPDNSIGGGVGYFLWDRNYDGDCEFVNIHDGKVNTQKRRLNEFPVLVRYNEAISIIHKVLEKKEPNLGEIVSSISPFGLDTSVRGDDKKSNNSLTLYSSKGVGYISRRLITQGLDYIDKYKLMISQVTSEHANESDKNGQFKVLSRTKVLGPGEICTFSYLLVGNFSDHKEAANLSVYLQSKFARFLLLQAISSIHISKDKFCFVPKLDFSRTWTDSDLYKKYNLSDEEILFIEQIIKPIESGEVNDGK